jgi:predicted neutral ceramidase superfamily lipid hydrolase
MRTLTRSVVSVIVGIALLFPLGAFYGSANLPVFHSWGLTHGSFTTAIPALVAGSFVGLGLLPWFSRSRDALPRLAACASVIVLATTLFYVDQNAQYAWSVWHAAVYAGLFGLFAILCVRAEYPLVLPLFLIVPLLVDLLFNLFVIGAFDRFDVEHFGHDLLRKVVPAAMATAMAAAAAKFHHLGKSQPAD